MHGTERPCRFDVAVTLFNAPPPMYLIAIAWLYVALMMAVAEATHSRGSVLGAVITFLLYGLGPVALLMYLLGTPMRLKAKKLAEQAERDAALAAEQPSAALDPDGGGHAAAAAVAPVREER